MMQPIPGEDVAKDRRGKAFTTVPTIPVSDNEENPYRYFISYLAGGVFNTAVIDFPAHIATRAAIHNITVELSIKTHGGQSVTILNFQLIAGPPRAGTER